MPGRKNDWLDLFGDAIEQGDEIQITKHYKWDHISSLDNLPEDIRKQLPAEALAELARKVRPPIPGLAALMQADPGFDQLAVMERVGTIIQQARRSEQTGQWDMARPFMSERFYRRWQPWAQSHQAGAGSSSVELTLTLAGAEAGPAADRILVRVVEAPMGSMLPQAVSLWTFVRSAARGRSQAQPGAGICTNCGAPIDLLTQSTCRYCGAGIATLAPEWVLDDVTPDTTAARPAA